MRKTYKWAPVPNLMAKRVESASSINTFKQCKRKYYYQYIVKLPTLPNIHQVRGNIAHSTLESFYDTNTNGFTEKNYVHKFQEAVQRLFLYHWNLARSELKKMDLTADQEMFYFEETMLMLINWCNHFIQRMGEVMKNKKLSVSDALAYLTPLREQEYSSEKLGIRGFIDAIHNYDDEIHLIDYKTNNDFEIKDSIKLQLAIYSLMYQEKHDRFPDKLGVFFLRHRLKLLDVDQEMLDAALKDIEMVHTHTSETEQVDDYPQNPGKLCKWGTGQCDFFEGCKPFENGKTIHNRTS